MPDFLTDKIENVFLFGAGASFGCGGVLPFDPPLGTNLFPALKKTCQTWKTLPSSLIDVFASNFENGMEEIRQKYSEMLSPLMREMAMFFAQFKIVLGRECLYQTLYGQLLERGLITKTIWSTLNYDCLAEISACVLGANLNYFDLPGKETFTVFKLHGSCNFVITGLSASSGIRFGGGISFGGGLRAIQPNDVPAECQKNVIQPSMSFYMKGKPNQVCPAQIEKIRKQWQDCVADASRIFIIGVNPNAEDAHIWEYLAKSPAKLHFVGDKDKFTRWAIRVGRETSSFAVLGDNWKDAEKKVILCF